jgi:hypothetical protein
MRKSQNIQKKEFLALLSCNEQCEELKAETARLKKQQEMEEEEAKALARDTKIANVKFVHSSHLFFLIVRLTNNPRIHEAKKSLKKAGKRKFWTLEGRLHRKSNFSSRDIRSTSPLLSFLFFFSCQ